MKVISLRIVNNHNLIIYIKLLLFNIKNIEFEGWFEDKITFKR